ncbi:MULTISPECIES: hypothetical protein [Bacillus cereus group]|uniref:Uncharacterized protein n=1 Tax=Bacillus proteolyticus TaxID=2026192 RepID=A0ABV3IJL1_9BACI|nr:hypothetical protein [Bacillus cereus group sp. N8]MBJ8107636.1 hypothetical protein [Bacillus cereus group sp. N8]
MIVLKLNVTPHIIFAGDKENVPEHLQFMFHKAMKMSILGYRQHFGKKPR